MEFKGASGAGVLVINDSFHDLKPVKFIVAIFILVWLTSIGCVRAVLWTAARCSVYGHRRPGAW